MTIATPDAIQTHFGMFPLKFFFSEGLQTDSGEVRSEITSQSLENVPIPVGRNYHIDQKDFSQRVFTAPVSPLGQRFYVKTKNATAVVAPTTLGVDPARDTHFGVERDVALHDLERREALRRQLVGFDGRRSGDEVQ
jgi:hypothetical protein